MKKRGRQRRVAMVTEIWLLFKNLECRWLCDESVCVLLLPHLSLSVLWMCWIHFAFTKDLNTISSFVFGLSVVFVGMQKTQKTS